MNRRALSLPRAFVAAHRGVVGAAHPENTLAAFEAAIAARADAIELDVRRLAGGELVVFHDESCAGRSLKQLTLTDLRRCSGFDVPTLAECLTGLKSRVMLDIELKDAGLEPEVLEETHRAGWSEDSFVVTSFHQSMPARVRAIRPEVRVGLLADTASVLFQLERFAPARRVTDWISTLDDIDFFAPQEPALNIAALDMFAAEGLPIVPWTVNDRARLAMLYRHPAVIGIITDNVPLAREVRREID